MCVNACLSVRVGGYLCAQVCMLVCGVGRLLCARECMVVCARGRLLMFPCMHAFMNARGQLLIRAYMWSGSCMHCSQPCVNGEN